MTVLVLRQSIIYKSPSSFIISLRTVFFNIFQRKFVLLCRLLTVDCRLVDFHPVQHFKEHLPQPGRLVRLRLGKVLCNARKVSVPQQLPDLIKDFPEQFRSLLQNCFFLFCGVAAFALQPVQKVFGDLGVIRRGIFHSFAHNIRRVPCPLTLAPLPCGAAALCILPRTTRNFARICYNC